MATCDLFAQRAGIWSLKLDRNNQCLEIPYVLHSTGIFLILTQHARTYTHKYKYTYPVVCSCTCTSTSQYKFHLLLAVKFNYVSRWGKCTAQLPSARVELKSHSAIYKCNSGLSLDADALSLESQQKYQAATSSPLLRVCLQNIFINYIGMRRVRN